MGGSVFICVAKDKDSWRDLRGVNEPSSALKCDPRSYSCSRSPDHVKYYKVINMDFFLPSSLQQVENTYRTVGLPVGSSFFFLQISFNIIIVSVVFVKLSVMTL